MWVFGLCARGLKAKKALSWQGQARQRLRMKLFNANDKSSAPLCAFSKQGNGNAALQWKTLLPLAEEHKPRINSVYVRRNLRSCLFMWEYMNYEASQIWTEENKRFTEWKKHNLVINIQILEGLHLFSRIFVTSRDQMTFSPCGRASFPPWPTTTSSLSSPKFVCPLKFVRNLTFHQFHLPLTRKSKIRVSFKIPCWGAKVSGSVVVPLSKLATTMQRGFTVTKVRDRIRTLHLDQYLGSDGSFGETISSGEACQITRKYSSVILMDPGPCNERI